MSGIIKMAEARMDMTPDKDEIITALNEVIREQQDKIEQLTAENEKLRAAIECALRQLADGNRVMATGTLADALAGVE